MYINKRIHSNNIRLTENLEVPTCRTATYYVPFTIDLSTLGTRLVQTQENSKTLTSFKHGAKLELCHQELQPCR